MTINRNLSFLAQGASSSGVLSVPYGGTGLTSLTASYIPYGNGTSAFNSSANLTFNGTQLTTTRLLASGDYATNAGDLTLTNTNGGRSWRIGDGIGGFPTSLIFWDSTGAAVRMAIGATGGVSIGNTTDPGAGNLYVNNLGLFGGSSQIAAIGNSGQTKLNAYGNGLAVNNGTSSAVFGGPNGNEGIWFTGGAFRVFNASVVGMYLLNGGTSWSNTSDETVKDIIEPISNGLKKIATLRSVIGKYKKDAEGTRRSFLIAQDVQKVLPEAVTELDGVLGVNYTDVIPLLVAAINDMKQQFDAYVASHP